jgi:hypothetical protein
MVDERGIEFYKVTMFEVLRLGQAAVEAELEKSSRSLFKYFIPRRVPKRIFLVTVCRSVSL